MDEIEKPWIILYEHYITKDCFEYRTGWFYGNKAQVIKRFEGNMSRIKYLCPVNEYIEFIGE